MEQTPSMPSSETPPDPAGSSLLIWFFASVIVVTALSLAAAHAPPRIRLIGLFSIAFGLLVGWLLVLLAEKLNAQPSRRLVGILAAVLSFAGLIGSTWETSRLDESLQSKSGKDLLADRLIEQIKSQSTESDSRILGTRALTRFRQYLSRRIRQIGDWPNPWPEAFWFAELLAAAAASAWVARRCLKSPSQSSTGCVTPT